MPDNTQPPPASHDRILVNRLVLLLAATLLLLAVFQSSALVTLTYDLPPGRMSEQLVGLAEQWHSAMQALGTAHITESITDLIAGLHDHPVD